MKSKAIVVALLFLSSTAAAFGQGREGRGRGRGLTAPPATDKVTPEIPGVVKAGTKLEIVNAALGCRDRKSVV